MSINVIHTNTCAKEPVSTGTVRQIITQNDPAKDVRAAIHEIEPDKSLEFDSGNRSHLYYIINGSGGRFSFKGENYAAAKGTGLYLEPGEKAAVSAGAGPLTLLQLHVPKHTTKPANAAPASYYFDENKLQTLISAGKTRVRSFWVNKETGLSGSWDMQAGLMLYTPNGFSPRHKHEGTPTNPEGAVHFYMIFEGNGKVIEDTGTTPIGPGDLVLIPAGEWHQLVASETGLRYMEFQGPFDFASTMDNDPEGKDWFIKGTDDGTGKPVKWVQS
jgi:mannose-6-phosphate isomerase-like protein (cupin superfamily)